jgi:hypothetical protein
MMKNLMRDSNMVFKKGNKRLIVQVSNWRHKTQHLSSPDLDFGRCIPLLNPDVSMVFIVPCEPDKSKLSVLSDLLSK